MSKEIHYVYQITNLINGKYYIGKHSTDNIDDNYFGSGKALMDAFDKYGKENFEKYVLQFCDTEEGAYELEGELVTIDQINDPMCYNMIIGGVGVGSGESNPLYGKKGKDAPRWGKLHNDETKRKMRDSHIGMERKKHSAETKRKMSLIKKGKKAHLNTIMSVSKSVCQIDIKTEAVISVFNSTNEAGRFFNKKTGSAIAKCANGIINTAYGYKWEYFN